MSAAWIGMVIGLVMGLTGSGGALVAIPLFILFLDMTLKEATSFSLVAVSLSALFNLFAQWESVDFKLSFWVIPFSILSSFFSIPLKEIISEWVIFTLLVLVSVFGSFSVWWPNRNPKQIVNTRDWYPAYGAILGLILGILTTLTGLGGGVLIMPALIFFFRFSPMRAVATSFLPILVTSLAAFLFQWNAGFLPPSPMVFLSLSAGIAFTAILFPFVLPQISPIWITWIRKIAFTLIVLFSLTKIFGVLK